MKLFFSVGEPSGDLHGANLVRALRARDASIQCRGFGGPRMQAAGAELLEDLTQLAVMGIVEAVRNVGQFRDLLRRADSFFQRERPDAVVLIDYPGFNWWIARQARRRGIPVFYYGAPQMWAWARWRIRKMRRLVDHVLCKLPFEAQWYRQRGCHARYVGHPYLDELQARQLDRAFLDELAAEGRPLVAILPGSRDQEVRQNLPRFLQAADLISTACPQARIAIAAFNSRQAEMARGLLGGRDIAVYVERTQELIQAARCCLACSGSVSLELLYYRTPSVIHYRLSRLSYYVARPLLLRVKYVTLVNLLACADRFRWRQSLWQPASTATADVPFPEYPTCHDRSRQLADHVIQWLTDEREYERRVALLDSVGEVLGPPGASEQAADYLLEALSAAAVPPPHFVGAARARR